MNVKKRLEHIARVLVSPIGHGVTAALINAAKQLDAIFLTHNLGTATDLQRKEKDLTVKSIDVNLMGLSGPFIIDHYAVSQLLLSAARKIEELEKEIQINKNETTATIKDLEYNLKYTKHALSVLEKKVKDK